MLSIRESRRGANLVEESQKINIKLARQLGLVIMKVQQAYTDWSTTYDVDRNLTRDLDQEVTRSRLADRHYKSVLELGCGTGKNTALLAEIGERVLALDFSAGMIARAKEKLARDNIIFRMADLTQPWPCGDQSFDLIACNLVLEHIADLTFIFREAFRTLLEGGRFFVSELHPFRQYQGTQANFLRDEERTQIPAFVHHVSDFLNAAREAGLALVQLEEWSHPEDQNKPPRLITFMFAK
jgi:ubiquinone/menaquinone biosynthesis C-methylase UbiE